MKRIKSLGFLLTCVTSVSLFSSQYQVVASEMTQQESSLNERSTKRNEFSMYTNDDSILKKTMNETTNMDLTQVAFVSTWQDFVFAINTPAIELIRLQNDIVLPSGAQLSLITRPITISGEGASLDLGNQQLNLLSVDSAFYNLKMTGNFNTLISYEAGNSHNVNFQNVEVDLKDGQTFVEGPTAVVYISGQNTIYSSSKENMPIAFKTHSVGIFDRLSTYDISLYDGTNIDDTRLPQVLVGSGANLDSKISYQANKPFVKNAELIDTRELAEISISSVSLSPVISFDREYLRGNLAFFAFDEQTNISIKSLGMIAESVHTYQFYSYGFNNVEIFSSSPLIKTNNSSEFSFSGTEELILENRSGGPIVADGDMSIVVSEFLSPVSNTLKLRPIGGISTPISTFDNFGNFLIFDEDNTLEIYTEDDNLLAFLNMTRGLRDISKIQIEGL